jgi:hypothetical protein
MKVSKGDKYDKVEKKSEAKNQIKEKGRQAEEIIKRKKGSKHRWFNKRKKERKQKRLIRERRKESRRD